MRFELDPDCGRQFPGVQLRFVTALGLRGSVAPAAILAFDLDKIVGPVIVRCDRSVLSYCGAEDATVTADSRNVVFVVERISAITVRDADMKQAQESLVELLRPRADAVIASVIEPETPRTDLQPDEPAFMV